jgi:tRNA dimethylallyltransferase
MMCIKVHVEQAIVKVKSSATRSQAVSSVGVSRRLLQCCMDWVTLSSQLLALGLPAASDWPQHYDAVLITGPTASGKSSLAMALAQLWPASIVSVDSALVYRGMDIGSAKPSHAEQAAVPHYLIDLIEPTASYSVAQFLTDAQAALLQSQAQGRLPLLVGGTMMYVNALYKGLSELPSVDVSYRQAIEARAAQHGWPALHAELMAVDATTANRLAPNDAQRIERALAVYQATGRPLSQWIAQAQPSQPLMGQGRCLHLSIEPEKSLLWQRIEQRFDTMLAAGFMAEMAALRARGDLNPDLPSMRCVGYRQAWAHLDGQCDVAAMRELGVIATRQLAKRQMTWLRGMPQRVVLTPLA